MLGEFSIQDMFQEFAYNISVKLNKTVHFDWGHPKSIVERLKILSTQVKNADAKYPLICLFTDFPKKRGTDPKLAYETLLHLAIITVTKKELTEQDREINNFIPVLRPIYEALINEIGISKKILQDYKDPKHEEWERFFWGRNPIFGSEPGVFDDYIDAIEIKNLEIKVVKKVY